MSQFSTEELNLLLHAVGHYARTGTTRETHVAPAWDLRDKLSNIGANYTGPTPDGAHYVFVGRLDPETP